MEGDIPHILHRASIRIWWESEEYHETKGATNGIQWIYNRITWFDVINHIGLSWVRVSCNFTNYIDIVRCNWSYNIPEKKNGTSTQGLCSSYRYDVDNISIQMHIRHHGIILFRWWKIAWRRYQPENHCPMAWRCRGKFGLWLTNGQRKEKYRTLLPKTRDVG